MHSGFRERLGLVEEARQKRALYGHYAYRAPALPPAKAAEVDPGTPAVRQRIEAKARRQTQVELAEGEAIGDQLPSLDGLLQLAAEVTNIPVQEFKGQCRAREIAWPRQFAMWLIRECRRDVSYPLIARTLGGRDHTTVMHGLRNVEAKRDQPPFKEWRDDWRVQAALSDWGTEP